MYSMCPMTCNLCYVRGTVGPTVSLSGGPSAYPVMLSSPGSASPSLFFSASPCHLPPADVIDNLPKIAEMQREHRGRSGASTPGLILGIAAAIILMLSLVGYRSRSHHKVRKGTTKDVLGKDVRGKSR